jgi:malonyl-CoA O-methyltransferase
MQQLIKEKFSNVCEVYEYEAALQKGTAERLGASLQPWRLTLPEGPVLEIGAGTGFLTAGLTKLLPEREITVTDISDEMVAFCKNKLSEISSDNLVFKQLDAELFKPQPDTYALIAGNFVAQWFRDPSRTLARLAEGLKPGGLLLMAFPGSDTFPEWKQRCRELGLPYTGNKLPDTEEMVIKLSMGPARVDFYEDSRTVQFPDVLTFFQYLKRIGATSKLHDKQLTAKQLKLLINNWNREEPGDINITWHLVFLALKKDK